MSVEIVTTINTLDATFPASTDPRSEGDDHIRNIKSALKVTFPNVAGIVTVSHSTLNNVQITQPVADTSTNPATTEFVKLAIANSAALSLPSTAGNVGKVLVVNESSLPVWGTGTPDYIVQSFGVI